MLKMKPIVYIFTTALLGISPVPALNEDSTKEGRCFAVQSYPGLDFEWVTNGTVKTWYYLLVDQLELYRFASDILDTKICDLPHSLANYSCPTCDLLDFNCIGFGALKPMKYDVTIEENLVIHFKARSKYALCGKLTFTLTDNKNFLVGVTCWEDNESSFTVWGPTPDSLSPAHKEQIHDHLKQLGFDPKLFVDLSCRSQIDTNSICAR